MRSQIDAALVSSEIKLFTPAKMSTGHFALMLRHGQFACGAKPGL